MDNRLNDEFRAWLGQLALDWSIPESAVSENLGPKEIENRLNAYPALGRAVVQDPIDMQQFGDAARQCWALAEKFDTIRLNEFLGHPESGSAVRAFVAEFPGRETEAAAR